MNPRTKKILTILLVIISAVFLVVFIKVTKDLITTRVKLKNVQVELAYGKIQKDRFQSELQKKIEELDTVNEQLNEVNQKLNKLEKDNSELLKMKQDLENKIFGLEKEKQDFEKKLHSLPELRKLIRQAKIKIHERRIQEYLVKKQFQKEMDAQKLRMGNRGFIIREGQATYKPAVKIEVKPVD